MKHFSNLPLLSPSLDYGRFPRRRRTIRHFKCVLASFTLLCLLLYYMDCLPYFGDASPDLSDPSSLDQDLLGYGPSADTDGSSAALPTAHRVESAGANGFSAQHLSPKTHSVKSAAQRSDFERNFVRVGDLLPGEMEARSLLNPIGGTGAEKLREIGLRAREYSRYLGAWEDLHFVENEDDDTFIRPDMVQYIRRFFSNGPGEAATAGVEQAIHVYERYRTFMCKFGQLIAGWTGPYFADHMALHLNSKNGGRGIVVTAGNGHAPHVKTLISTLRDVGCRLPVEVIYLDDGDLDVDVQAELEALDGVVTREIAPMVDDQGWKLAGWALKPFAILLSSFREVVFIDADSLFFHNPEILFDDADYKRTGALFFKDRSLFPESKKEWLKNLLPRPISLQVIESRFWRGESGHMQESGVIVVDKWRHFMALLIVCRMNGPERNGNKEKGIVGVYDMVYGDKETFWLGWELVGDTDYAFHRGGVAVMGELDAKEIEEVNGTDQTQDADAGAGDTRIFVDGQIPPVEKPKATPKMRICSPQLLHLDAEGGPLWFNGGLLDNKFLDRKDWEFGSFHHYIMEPATVAHSTWELQSHNKACLSAGSHLKRDFAEQEKEQLQVMISYAKRYL